MDENDFYVAIQGVMTQAKDAGWTLDKIHELATDAADEWLGEEEASGEYVRDLPDEDEEDEPSP